VKQVQIKLLARQSCLKLMRRIDERHLEVPFCGPCKIEAQLRRETEWVGRRHVRVRGTGMQVLHRRHLTSIPARELSFQGSRQ
jgi:putative transposase